jgi:hypothetical protein
MPKLTDNMVPASNAVTTPKRKVAGAKAASKVGKKAVKKG